MKIKIAVDNEGVIMEKIFTKINYMHMFSVILIGVLGLINLDKLDYPIILNDEFGYWANAAVFIEGYNWKDLFSETPYYSWGYSLVLYPIMLIIKNPYLRYKMAIVINVILLESVYFIVYRFGRKIFPKIDKMLISAVAFLTVIYPNNIVQAQITWPETLLYFWAWCISLLILNLDFKFDYKKFLGVAVMLGFSYIIHARCIGIIVVGIITLTLILIKNKKNILLMLLPVLIIVLFYMLNEVVKQYLLEEARIISEISDLNNISVNTDTVIAYIQKFLLSVKMYFGSAGAKFVYLLFASGFVVMISIFMFLKSFISNIRKKKLFSNFIITKFWAIASIGVMWVITALQMLYWLQRKDILVYARYMEYMVGPILFLGLVYMLKEVRVARLGVIVSGIIMLLTLEQLYIRINLVETSFVSVNSPSFGAFYDVENPNITEMFYNIGMVSIILFVLLILLMFIKKSSIRVWGICVLYFVFFLGIGYKSNEEFNIWHREYFEERTKAVRDVITSEYVDEDVYYIVSEEFDLYSDKAKYLQFTIPQQGIQVVTINEIEEKMKIERDAILILCISKDHEIRKKLEANGVEYLISTSMLTLYKYE